MEKSKDYYQKWEVVLYESIVRANVRCYLKIHDEDYDATFDNNEGFPWTQELSENLLKNYVGNKDYNS